mmetsp:Transcript_26728/g.48443  ORF Transcript_26728/g.48443 Transcript_26728/m.48443 type:complete len:212 (+) Transcript_26728:831-1466(+)
MWMLPFSNRNLILHQSHHLRDRRHLLQLPGNHLRLRVNDRPLPIQLIGKHTLRPKQMDKILLTLWKENQREIVRMRDASIVERVCKISNERVDRHRNVISSGLHSVLPVKLVCLITIANKRSSRDLDRWRPRRKFKQHIRILVRGLRKAIHHLHHGTISPIFARWDFLGCVPPKEIVSNITNAAMEFVSRLTSATWAPCLITVVASVWISS